MPLEMAAILCVTFALVGGLAGRHYSFQRMPAHGSPAFSAERPSQRGPVAHLAAGRSAVPEASRAVLLGRIYRMNHNAQGFSAETLQQVAEVMRASLRRDDRLTIRDSETVTLEIDSADEGLAAKIAQRLRDTVAKLGFLHGRSHTRLFANFGVAAGTDSVAGDVLIRRAREALKMALQDGEEHIVKASELTEIKLLPPPDPVRLASAA